MRRQIRYSLSDQVRSCPITTQNFFFKLVLSIDDIVIRAEEPIMRFISVNNAFTHEKGKHGPNDRKNNSTSLQIYGISSPH